MAWIKKHLKKIIGILVVVLILVGAYWYGGNAPGSRGFGRPGTTSENTESTTQGRFPGKLQIQKMLMRKYRMMRNGMTHHRQDRVQQRKIIVKGIRKKTIKAQKRTSPES